MTLGRWFIKQVATTNDALSSHRDNINSNTPSRYFTSRLGEDCFIIIILLQIVLKEINYIYEIKHFSVPGIFYFCPENNTQCDASILCIVPVY